VIPEQTALVQKARDSLRAAKLLADDGLYDFAASRAYYTMFYLAEACLLGRGLSFSKHAAVIAGFGQHFAKPGLAPVKFHRYLIDGQDRRTVGDYSIGPGLTEAQAAGQIAHAEEFLTWSEHALATPGESKGHPTQ
jgi:uncharacterized protein (UPF0332 family)